jgi:regulator of replication initiation timing
MTLQLERLAVDNKTLRAENRSLRARLFDMEAGIEDKMLLLTH